MAGLAWRGERAAMAWCWWVWVHIFCAQATATKLKNLLPLVEERILQKTNGLGVLCVWTEATVARRGGASKG